MTGPDDEVDAVPHDDHDLIEGELIDDEGVLDDDGSWSGDGFPEGGAFGDDPRVQAGVEHLQRAANELIAASRALLDVVEELVEDPRSVGGLLGVFANLGEVAARAARQGTRGGPAGHSADDDDDDPPVQRIPVS